MNTALTDTIAISPVKMQARKKLDIHSGDTVRVWVKVQEKGKTRKQAFEGLVLARKHGSQPGATFTVRRSSGGHGVERIFPLYSPAIDTIEVLKRAKTRRAKLYYIREKAAREIRRQMRRQVQLNTQAQIHVDDTQMDADNGEENKQEEQDIRAGENQEVKSEEQDPKTSPDEDVQVKEKQQKENTQTKEDK